MDEAESIRLIRSGFNEILAGYTPLQFQRNDLYLKHFNTRDQIEVDVIFRSHLERIKERGVPTSGDKAKELLAEGLWVKADDDFLVQKQQEIHDLKNGKRLMFIKSQIDDQQKLIEKAESAYLIKIMQKNELFGKTAEFFANKRVSDFCVVNSIFRDSDFKHPFFSKEDLFDLDDDTMEGITAAYKQAVEKFDELGLKKIALSNLFQNYFVLAKSIYEFYGKAISQLTFYQVQLASYGDYYKNVLFSRENQPPVEVASDPEKLEDWLTGSAHAKKVMENTLGPTSDGEGVVMTSIMGAKKEDHDYLGVAKESGISLIQKTIEAGGHLKKEDLMKLMGVNE